MNQEHLPLFFQMGLDGTAMFPIAYDGYDYEYFYATIQLWAMRERLA